MPHQSLPQSLTAAGRRAATACAVAALCLLSNCYVLKQGVRLLEHRRRARPVDEVMADSATDEKTREFLRLVERVRRFAIDSVGLAEDENFTELVNVDKDYLIDVVAACRADTFEAYTWWYPFLGSFPYKGFYEKEDALREADKLRRKGYDVYVRRADAFSTLGILEDPLYSFMADYSPYGIASLIIHEQTHATIFIKSEVQFNEELASFVGREGALWFVRSKYGSDAKAYRNSVGWIKDYRTFLAYLRRLYNELDTLYKSDLPREETLERKHEIFAEYETRYAEQYDSMFVTEKFRGFAERELNNAYLISYMTYTQDLSLFYELYEQNDRDLRRTVEQLKALPRKHKDPKKYVRELLERED